MAKKKLTEGQRKLLNMLVENDGESRWLSLNPTECGHETRMEKDGLCRWEKNASGWPDILHITDAGRAALAEAEKC